MSALEETIFGIIKPYCSDLIRNDRSMFGTPDFVVNGRKLVIFVHGCFWHGHNCKIWNVDGVWSSRISAQIKRDAEVRSHYVESKSQYLRIWGCELETDYLSVEHKIISLIQNL